MANKSKRQPNKQSSTEIAATFSSLGPERSSFGIWMMRLISKISSEFISEDLSWKTPMNPMMMLMLKTLKSDCDAKSWALVSMWNGTFDSSSRNLTKHPNRVTRQVIGYKNHRTVDKPLGVNCHENPVATVNYVNHATSTQAKLQGVLTILLLVIFVYFKTNFSTRFWPRLAFSVVWIFCFQGSFLQ